MPDITPRLGIKKPLGNENVTRVSFNENWDIIDANAAKKTEVDTKAPLASPALTGTPTAPTAPAGTNTTQVATTAFVQVAVGYHGVDQSHVPYAIATGSANTYAVELNPATTAYVEGMAVAVKISTANTGAATINVNGLGSKAIKKANGNAVSSGNLKAGSIYTLRYNGTDFILQGEGGGGTAQPGDVKNGVTFTNDNGEQVGTATILDSYFGDGSDGVFDGDPTPLPIPTLYPNFSNLIDGNTNTSVSNSLGANELFVTFDYASPVHIEKWDIIKMTTNLGTMQLTIVYSNDKLIWTQFGSSFSANTGQLSNSASVTGGISARYWGLKCISVANGAASLIVFELTPTPTTNYLIPNGFGSGIVVKNYTNFQLGSGKSLTTQSPVGALIIYVDGDATIKGNLNVNNKASLYANEYPILPTKTELTKFNQLLISVRGGAGGNGGNGGGQNSSNNAAASNGGAGGSGRAFGGGFGGGGGGGHGYAYQAVVTDSMGGAGGSVLYPNICLPINSPTVVANSGLATGKTGFFGQGGSGGAFSTNGPNAFAGEGGACYGGGGGGGGGANYQGSGIIPGGSGETTSYAGGYIVLIVRGNLTITNTGSVQANGSNGGKGGNGSQAAGGGGGGGAGGGIVILYYKGVLINNGSIQVNGGLGGAAGASYGSSGPAMPGTSGSVGTIVTKKIQG